MRSYLRILALGSLVGPTLAGCAGVKALDPSAAAPLVAALPEGTPAPAFEPIWTSVLRWYRRHPDPTAGDVACNFLAVMRQGSPCRAPTALLLRPGPHPAPYAREWVASLVAAHVLEGICAGGEPTACGASDMATYVGLTDPTVTGQDAELTVAEMGFNAAGCRRPGTETVYGAVGAIVFHLNFDGRQWRVGSVEGGRLPINVRCHHP